MNGKRMRLEKVESPPGQKTSEPSEKQDSPSQEKVTPKEKGAKVISLEDLKRKT
jgi:hypothetical protein